MSTQTEIDNFATDYPGCTTIVGDLIISGSTINDLSGFAQLEKVNNSLDIDNCDNLSDLINLSSINIAQYKF